MTSVSPYLKLPLRTEAEIRAERAALREANAQARAVFTEDKYPLHPRIKAALTSRYGVSP